MSQIRLGVLSLKIETDKYTRVPLEKRLCPVCDMETETQSHFLFDCEDHLYVEQRKTSHKTINNLLSPKLELHTSSENYHC